MNKMIIGGAIVLALMAGGYLTSTSVDQVAKVGESSVASLEETSANLKNDGVAHASQPSATEPNPPATNPAPAPEQPSWSIQANSLEGKAVEAMKDCLDRSFMHAPSVHIVNGAQDVQELPQAGSGFDFACMSSLEVGQIGFATNHMRSAYVASLMRQIQVESNMGNAARVDELKAELDALTGRVDGVESVLYNPASELMIAIVGSGANAVMYELTEVNGQVVGSPLAVFSDSNDGVAWTTDGNVRIVRGPNAGVHFNYKSVVGDEQGGLLRKIAKQAFTVNGQTVVAPAYVVVRSTGGSTVAAARAAHRAQAASASSPVTINLNGQGNATVAREGNSTAVTASTSKNAQQASWTKNTKANLTVSGW